MHIHTAISRAGIAPVTCGLLLILAAGAVPGGEL